MITNRGFYINGEQRRTHPIKSFYNDEQEYMTTRTTNVIVL